MKSPVKTIQLNRSPRRMGTWVRGAIAVGALFVALGLLTGCHSDPNVVKQKYLESGKKYSAEGNWREAAIQFSNAVKIDKNFSDAHYQLAQTYLHLGAFRSAYSEFQRTVDLQPTNYEARIALGNLLLLGGKIDDAQAQANAVVAAQPSNPGLHLLLSAIAQSRGDKDQALAEIDRALQLAPNRSSLHENRALLLADDPAKSSVVEDELKKAAALDPHSANAKILLATFYIRSSRWTDAEQASRDAIAVDPKNLPAREVLAQVFLKQGDQAKAEQVLRQASQDLSDKPLGVQMLADYYMASGQSEKARAEFASLYAKYPSNLDVEKGYVRSLLQVNDLDTAYPLLASLSKSHSKDPEVIALNGIVLIHEGKARDAVNALETAVGESPRDPFLQFWLGKAALANDDHDLAERSLLEAQKLNPGMISAEEELACIASQQGDMSLLADVAEKTIVAAPRFPLGYVWRAMVEMSHNLTDKAETDLRTAIAAAPQDPRPYIQLAKLRFAQKRFPDGVSQLELALQFDPDSVEALRLLMSHYLCLKQPGTARARLNAQINKRPKNSGFDDLLAQLEIQSRNLDQAAATAKKAMQLDPGDAEAEILYVQIEMQLGQTANAIASWQQWIDSRPGDASALALLGALEESSGNRSQAEVDYRKALEIQPRQPLAANNLAFLMLQNGENTDVALTLAQTARRVLPDSPSTADTLAWAYFYKGTYRFARDLLEDAVKAEPDNAAIQYHLGMVYSKLRDRNDAETHLKKALSLQPNSTTGKEARAALSGLG
jgi:tetratricopeptide (TPR) repeat protein